MGYYTDFKVNVSDTAMENCFHHVLQKTSGYQFHDNGDYLYLGDAKWYDWNEHLSKISQMDTFKNELITVEGDGEEQGDMWKAYFLNGNVKVAKAVVSFPEVDMSEFYIKESEVKELEHAK